MNHGMGPDVLGVVNQVFGSKEIQKLWCPVGIEFGRIYSISKHEDKTGNVAWWTSKDGTNISGQ